ncbi:MAG: S49 family peptidase [Oceanospirillaceae bacterium]|nr:S49 family peptidase [Oceanospirillaceae bacterium]
MNEQPNTPEWQVIGKLVTSIQDEQRRSRRWGIFFKGLFFIFIFSVLAMVLFDHDADRQPPSKAHVAVVNVFGPIMAGTQASTDHLLPSLEDAFAAPNAKAVVLNIDSPGGSPVQAGIIFDELQRLKQAHPEKPLYAIIGDVGASGAYYIAAAADLIYADKASTVGSIGVIGSGFGFDQLMAKVGIERRTYTAGGNKDFLDPFLPQKENQKMMFQKLLDEVHQQFITQVELGRGDRLVPHEDLYSGAVFHGARAMELGLIDGLGSLHSVTRDQIGVAHMRFYSPEKTPFQAVIDELGVQAKTAISWGFNKGLIIQ